MRKRKRIITISVILICLLVGTYLAMRSGIFAEQFKGVAVRELEKLFSRKVHIRHIDTNFFNRINLRGVRIAKGSDFTKGDLLTIDKVSIHLNLLNFINKKPKLVDAIKSITLVKPAFELSNKEGNWNISLPLASGPEESLRLKVFIYRGQVSVEDVSGGPFDKLKLRSLKGLIDLSLPAKKHIQFTTKTSLSKKDKVSLNIDFLGDNFEADLILEKGNLSNYSKLIKFSISKYNLTEGLFDGNVSLVGNMQNFNNIVYKGKLNIKGATVQIEDVKEDISDIKAELVLENGMISSNKITAKLGKYPFTLRGNVLGFESDISLDLELDFPDAEYDLLTELADSIASIGEIYTLGQGSFDCRVKGPLDDLSVDGRVKIIKGEVLKEKVSDLTAKFQYQNKLFSLLSLSTGFYKGRMSVSGTVGVSKKPAVLNFDLRAENVDLPGYLRLAENQKDVKGRATLIGKVTGNVFAPLLQAKVTSNSLYLMKYEIPILEGKLKYHKDELLINTYTTDRKYKVDTTLYLRKDSISVKEFSVSWDKSMLNIEGVIDLKNKNMDLDIKTSGLKAEDFPPVKKYYKDLTGEFSFSGKLKGKLDDLAVSGKILSEDLLLAKKKVSLFADFTFSGKALDIASLEINKAYKAKGKIIFSDMPDSPYLDVDISVEDGQLYILGVLCRIGKASDENIKGIIDGNLRLKGPFRDLTGGGEIKLQKTTVWDRRIENLHSSFAIYNNKLDIAKFILQQNGGKIKGTAQFGIKADSINEFNLDLDLEEFMFEEILFAGDLNVKGTLGYGDKKEAKAILLTSGLKINNQPQEIKARLTYEDKVLYISPVSSKDNYTFTGDINFKQEPEMDVKLNIKNVSVGHLLRLVKVSGVDEFTGNLNGYVRFKGSLRNPELIGNVDINKGNLRNFEFDKLKVLLLFKDNILFLKEVKGTSKKGKFLVRGNINFDKAEQQLDLAIEMEDMELKSLSNAYLPRLKEPVDARLNGAFKVTGNFVLPVVEGNLIFTDFRFNKYRVASITTDFSFKDKTFKILRLRAEESGGVLKISEGSGIELISDGVFSFDLLVGLRNINLAGLSLFGGVYLKGKIDSTGSDTRILVDIITDGLWMNEHKFDKSKLKVSYSSGELEFLPVPGNRTQLIGKINFKEKGVYYFKDIYILKNNRKSLIARGYIKEKDRIDLTMKTENFDAGVIAGLIGIKVPVDGMTSLDLKISGTQDSPYLTGNIGIAKGGFGKFKFDNLSIVATAMDGVINIKRLSIDLSKDKLNIVGKGEIPFAFTKEAKQKIKGQQINLSLDIFRSNLSILTDLSSKIRKASGEIDAKLDVKGTIDDPLVNGYIKLRQGKITAKEVIKKATDVEIDIIIVKNKITINKLSGKIGDGYLNIAGNVRIENYSLKEFDVELATSRNVGINLSIMGFIPKGKPKMRLHIYGDEKIHYLDGEIELVNTHFTYPPQKTNGGGGKDIFEIDFFKNAIWNLEIRAGDNTWYENNLVTANITGGLEFKGREENFRVTGTVEALKGDVEYMGVEFKILHAVLAFHDNVAYLEGKGETKKEDDIITLVIEKTRLKDIKPKFYSQQNPEMSQEKVIGLLIYGKDFSDPQQDALYKEDLNKFLLREMFKLVDANLSSRFIRPILKDVGLDELVDVVKVKTMIIEKSTSPEESILEGSQLTFGKYFTNRVYVSYTTLFKAGLANKLELKHRVELEYRIQGSKFLKMRMDSEEKFMGIENQIRF